MTSSHFAGHYQYREFTFVPGSTPSQFILSSALLHGNAQFQYVSRKKRKAIAGPVDVMGRIEKMTVYGFPADKKVNSVSLNYSKPVSFSQIQNILVIKLPLVYIDESWDIIIDWA